MRILNFGSMNLDFVYEVEGIVRPGETVRALSRRTYCGGKGLNQSVALARAGADVCHAGLIGTDDEIAHRIIEFKKQGVNLLLTAYLHFQEELTHFGEEIIPRVRALEAELAQQNGVAFRSHEAAETAAPVTARG